MSRLKMHGPLYNATANLRKPAAREMIPRIIFTACAFSAIIAVFSITVYMFIFGLPAVFRVGLGKLLFSTSWKPTANPPSYGILSIILTSVFGTAAAVCIGVPMGLFSAIYLAETAPPLLSRIITPAVELLAGIPSVIYGLIGVKVLCPLIYKLELAVFPKNSGHVFTGGANLISAVLVLSVMILPTVISLSKTALESVPDSLEHASLGLGASKMQTVFKVKIPAAKSGIIAAAVLGTGRAIGETMAISLVSGSSVNLPLPFNSVRFLTSAIVNEMGYAADLHRQVLFTIGLVLFIFIMMINTAVAAVIRRGGESK